jgi:TIR domain
VTLRIVCCSVPEDKKLVNGLRAHLRTLENGLANIQYTHQTLPGKDWQLERDRQLLSAHLILLLISADFLHSQEYEEIVGSAMERYRKGEVQVVPVILRPVLWQGTPFGELLPLPREGQPVTDEKAWKTLDHAFLNIVQGIKRIIQDKQFLPSRLAHEDVPLSDSEEPATVTPDATTQLRHLIQGFKLLRGQIASAASLRIPQGFSVESCENQYTRLYGDTLVFLATYLPQSISEEDGFVEIVYRKAAEQLRQRNNFSVWLARQVIAPLAELEKLASQMDACVATLELYQQKYFR